MSMTTSSINRRQMLTGAGTVALLGIAGCSSTSGRSSADLFTPLPTLDVAPMQPEAFGTFAPEVIYAAVEDNGIMIPAVPWKKVPQRFHRQMVPNMTGELPGTLVVDTINHFVYYTQPDGMAMRYGVGLGRAGFEWSGRGYIERKAQWPKWHPPAEMIESEPKVKPCVTIYDRDNDLWLGGMEGGLTNPLGARALYIYQDGKDTLYRLHGSPEWNSIGNNVSSGCVRLMNQDIIDLHARVSAKTEVIVTGGLPIA